MVKRLFCFFIFWGLASSLWAIPLRVVSLAPSITQTICALGAEERLVGVTRFCDGPAEVAIVGGLGDPNYEMIVALAPDLVCLSGLSGQAVEEHLKSLGLNTLMTSHEGFAGILTDIERVGEVLGLEEEAEALTQGMHNTQQAIEARAARLPRKRVLFLLGQDHTYSVGPQSFIHDIITSAGGENIAATMPMPWPHLSREFILGQDPEFIFIANKKDLDIISLQNDPFWSQLAAVRAGKVYKVDQKTIHVPGPRVVEALVAIHQCLEY